MAFRCSEREHSARSSAAGILILLVILAIIGAAAYWYFRSRGNPTPDDTDGDGVLNSQDFYDSGNGAVQVVIDSFQMTTGEICQDSDVCDITFGFVVDREGYGTPPYDCERSTYPGTHVYWDIGEAEIVPDANAGSITCDVPDDTSSVHVAILVGDMEDTYSSPIDLAPTVGGNYPPGYEVTVSAPFSEQHTTTGDGYGFGSQGATLTWHIQVVAA